MEPTLSDVYAPPSAAPASPTHDAEAIRRAGELGFATLVMLGANACCGVLIFVVPITGGMALWQARGRQPVEPVDHLWMRLALTGGWLGLTIGLIFSLVFLGYIALVVGVLLTSPEIWEAL